MYPHLYNLNFITKASQGVLQYLNANRNMMLCYQGGDLGVLAHFDLSFLDDLDEEIFTSF